ncbi:MAG: hypothetical protein Q9225_007514, partial [Loekoesia sp. 1 TL-2023]
MSHQRIAILECDPLTAPIRAKYGSYGGVVTAFLRAGAGSIHLPLEELVLSIWNVYEDQSYPSLEEIDAVVITGS